MLFAVLLPLLFACFVPFISKIKQSIHTGVFVFFIPFIIFVYFVRYVGKDFSPFKESYQWIPSLGINLQFYLDGLSLLFVLLISGIGALVVLYSIYYLDKTERLGHFYVFLLMFMAAMLGVVLSDNVFVLYTFWELTSISSFLLIGYWHFNERSRYGALKSLLITIFGGLSMFGGFMLLSVITETTSIQAMIEQKEVILDSPYLPLILGFVLFGAFTKSAQFPFHIWLPDAMEAPTPVSAYLHSATMVKAGLYLIARMSPIFASYEWFFIIVSIAGIITLCWGSYVAVRQTDLKAILAYSTISQLGMIMAMLGFGTKIAVFAAIFHILNHATFKGSLFMVAGIVDHQTGTRDIRKLGGLLTFLPITATLALFGTFSMAGVPLPFLNGFYSKEGFFESTLFLQDGIGGLSTFLVQVIPYLAVLGSIFTFVYSLYFFFGIFEGKKGSNTLTNTPREAPFGMLLSPIILVFGVIIIGLLPNLFNSGFLNHAAQAVNDAAAYEKIQFWHGLNTPFLMTLLVVGLGIILVSTRKKWSHIYNYVPGKFSFDKVYDWFIKKLDIYTANITNFYMNGSLRTYAAIIISAIFVVTLLFMVMTGGFSLSTNDLADISIIEVSVVLIMIIASIATIFARSKLSAILILGVVGYGVAILFVIYRAPDLGLTQLVIETITVALFLLCFYHLPPLKKQVEKTSSKVINAAVSIGFGALMSVIAISATSSPMFDSISEYFIRKSESVGGGSNIVNVILVDMRGLDTLFEITVLGISALAIFSLIKLKNNKEVK